MIEAMSKRLDDIKELPTQVKRAPEEALRVLRSQARRPDRVGEVTHRTWELVHDGVGIAARSLTRLERVTQPPARAIKHSSHRASSPRATENPGEKASSGHSSA